MADRNDDGGDSKPAAMPKKDNGSDEPSEEEMRKLLKPCPTEEQVLEVLKKSYVPAHETSFRIVKALDSYDDANYKVEIAGEPYLLKVHNGVESRDFLAVADPTDYYKKGRAGSCIHFQNAIMEILNRNHVPTNVPVPPRDEKSEPSESPVSVHKLPVLSDDHSPCSLVVRLLCWVPGRPMNTIQLLPLETLADAGRVLGRMDHALDLLHPNDPLTALRKSQYRELKMPSIPRGLLISREDDHSLKSKVDAHLKDDPSLLQAAKRYHQWDGRNTADLRNFVHCIHDDKRRHMVESVIDAFQTVLIDTGVGEHFRTGVNHGDFNDANIMVDDLLRVSGVVDFGDSVESWRVLEVSVAMAYAMLSSYGKANRSISAAAAVLRGYNSVYPLTDTERKHLVLLMACRLACSVTLGAYSYQENPENEYLLLHSVPAWRALELLWGYDAEKRDKMVNAVDHVFQQACLYTDSREDIVTSYDLVMADPTVADFLQSVRVPSIFDTTVPDRPRKRRRTSVTKSGQPVITFITGNEKKLEEVQRILGLENGGPSDLPFHLTNAKIDLPELQGEAISVAREKCVTAAEKVEGAVMVEDTSLCFNALNGMPGVFIKWFLDAVGHEGLNKMIAAYDDKTAYAQTVVAFSPGPGHDPALFVGRTDGKIVMPRGRLDFGWDPVFEPNEGRGRTYAEMSKEEKDAISHRSRAFTQMRHYLQDSQAEILRSMDAAN